MKHFLQKLASSVMRPQPSLHPFAESRYAAPRTSVDRWAQGSEVVVGTSRPQPSPSQPVPIIESQPYRAAQKEAQAWPRERDLSIAYRPLLPMRETQESAADGFALLRQRKKETHDEHESAPESMRGEQRATASLISERDNERARESQLARQIRPLIPQADAQSLIAVRRPAVATAQLSNRHHHERRDADDIQINIGRIEVIAVSPPTQRSTPAPARKGMSLDDYLSRRNGRIG